MTFAGGRKFLSRDKIFNIVDKILSRVVVAAQAAVLSLCADVFKLRNRRAEKIRLVTRRLVDVQKNFALQSVFQRRLRPG